MTTSNKWTRVFVGSTCVAGLCSIYVFQKVNLADWMGVDGPAIHQFILNRSIRFFLNDIFVIGIIFAIYNRRKFVIFSCWVQVVGMVLFLLPYLVLKYNFPNYNGPLLNFIHRLVLNPTLLLMLIPVFYLHEKKQQISDR